MNFFMFRKLCCRLPSVVFLLSCSSLNLNDPVSNLKAAERERMESVPVTEADGTVRTIQVRLCLPSASTPSRVVIMNHGSPPRASDRPSTNGFRCESEPAKWFLDRHYLVAAPIRRGYGVSGGKWSESYGSCSEGPDFIHAGLETARDIHAVTEYVASLPEALPEQMVVVGQSAGGWGTIAYNSVAHPRVSAMINMAGGRGGHFGGAPNQNCRPDFLATAAGIYGQTARTPMLWIYSENDSFFDPSIAASLFQSFMSGGGQGQLIQLPPFGRDGHQVFAGPGGSGVWGRAFEEYLSEH